MICGAGVVAVVLAGWSGGLGVQTSTSGARAEAALRPRILVASRIHGRAPVVDGRLDEAEWTEAEIATDFIQRRPTPGALATVGSEARVLYDDRALFIGVRLLEPAPEGIVAPYPRRDDETTSDWVFVEFDSRRDRRTAFSFGLNPRGVQVDGVFQNDVDYDPAWNAVWEGAARIDGAGWTAEYRIPFSQLVYAMDGAPSADGSSPAVFGMNVFRYSPRRGESSNWAPRLPSLAGVVSNFNELRLRVPARRGTIEITPFASTRTASPGPGPFGGGTSAAGGADLRAGLGSAFTLTAAVRPDFGQVEADPSEVNLTTFETLYTERRPLFVENAGLFAFNLGLPFVTRGNSFAAEQAFYSRRIGRPPRLSVPDDARLRETPDAPALLAAAKLTGRTSGGWSVGGLAAVTGSETARFVDASGLAGAQKVEPRTEFAVARVSRDFASGRSAVGAIATIVGRSGMTPELSALLPSHSFALGVDARHRFARDVYEATGFLLGGAIAGTTDALGVILRGPGHYVQRPDRTHIDGDGLGTSSTGFAGQVRLARIGGEHWRWALAAHAISPRLDLNDVGFQRNADWIVGLGSLAYQHEQPGRLFRRWAVGSNQIGAGWSFGGERRAAVLNLNANADLHNYWGASIQIDHERPALEVEALRGGPALLKPPRAAAALSLYSDTRRSSQLAFEAKAFHEHETGSRQIALSPTLSVRAADRLAFSVGPSFDRTTNAWQYVGAPVAAGRTHYVLGRLEQTTVALTARVDLAFSPRLTLQLYAQPFASAGRFEDYKEVIAPRAARAMDRVRLFAPAQVSPGPEGVGLRFDLGPDGVGSLADPTYHVRDLRGNLVLRWEYRPGSALFVVWSQQRDATREDPFSGAFREVFGSLGVKPANTFLVKLSYWFAPRR